MKIKRTIISTCLLLALGYSSNALADNAGFGVEIKRPNVTANDSNTQRIASKNFKEIGALEDYCTLPKAPEKVEIPAPVQTVVDLKGEFGRYFVKDGESLMQVLKNVQATIGEEVSRDKLSAALMRANPKKYNNYGPIAKAMLVIPSVERINLESEETGKKIFNAANSKSLKNFTLPDLVKPWEHEVAIIAKKKEQQKQVLKDYEKAKVDYESCVKKYNAAVEQAKEKEKKALEELKHKAEAPKELTPEEKAKIQAEIDANTEMDIASEELMIKVPQEEVKEPKYEVNEQGKRIIRLSDKDNEKNNKQNAEEPKVIASTVNSNNYNKPVSGSSIVISQTNVVGKNSKGEVVDTTNIGEGGSLRMLASSSDASLGRDNQVAEGMMLVRQEEWDSVLSSLRYHNQRLETMSDALDKINNKLDKMSDKGFDISMLNVFNEQRSAFGLLIDFVAYLLLLGSICFGVYLGFSLLNRKYHINKLLINTRIGRKFLLSKCYKKFLAIRYKLRVKLIAMLQASVARDEAEYHEEQEKIKEAELNKSILRDEERIRQERAKQAERAEEERRKAQAHKPNTRFYAYDSDPIVPVAINEIEEPISNISPTVEDEPVSPKSENNII